nr:MAG TPA: Protein of unknown function (DUF1642) [Caudoviricetes sp.]
MNKKELKKHIEGLPYSAGLIVDTIKINRNGLLKLIEQLDEPQKVVVSEEEAKFLETFDFNCESDVTTALYHVSRTGWGYYLRDNDGIELKDLSKGFRELENRKRLIKAILDGYEVEKEKRYTVKIKGELEENLLVYGLGVKKYFFTRFYDSSKKGKHTRKELEEAVFGEVFDSPLFEVEEVEG